MPKAINKVVYGGNTILDLTDLTVDQDKLLRGYTARRADGNKVTGTVDQTVEYLQAGGTVTLDENDYLEFDDSGGITPTGTIAINQNGVVDVTNYASANVNVSPSLQSKTNIDPSMSSQTITADSGYDGLSSVQINAMPSGSAGTPVATKGSVSDHSISVTPSVTNTAGYISGGTKSGTAITVSASELVSGSETKTANGTYDVTNLAELLVNVPSPVKTATGTFTGNGTRQVTIPCDFEPDLIYWTSDPGTTSSSGTVAGIIARGMMAANRYRNNSTSNSHYGVIDITDMNTGGSSYSHRATYSNSTVTLYCFSNNARSLFTNGRTYTYRFLKWTT